MSEPVSGADLLARIRPRLNEGEIEICLRPDLIDEWQEANETLQELVAAGMKPGRIASKPTEQIEAAKRVQDLEQQIQAASAVFRFRALPKDEWRALCDDHPPRKGNEVDHWTGYNRDAVLDAAVRASLYDPVFDDESWANLVAVTSGGEWEELRKEANSVNRGVNDNPKSELASSILTRHASGSE